MKAREIMTRDPITVSPATSVREIASLMAEKHVSGLPVVDGEGHLLGIVSQSDLLHRAEIGTEQHRKPWMSLLADPEKLARDYVKTHGLRAHDVMSRHVISIGEDADLRQVADTLDEHHFKRLPVVREGKIVGIITRGDIVRALVKASAGGPSEPVGNSELRERLLKKMKGQSWLDDSFLNLAVSDGVVKLSGMVKSESQRTALKIMIEETEGTRRVEDDLRIMPTFTTLY